MGLKKETFLAVAEMLASHLRLKEADRWSVPICKLKYVSFQSSYPEVNDQQFLWAAEQFVQSTSNDKFLRYPTWNELMSFLYRTENGTPNRSWGFKESLPRSIQPTREQLALMPRESESLHRDTTDPQNQGAYKTFRAALPEGDVWNP